MGRITSFISLLILLVAPAVYGGTVYVDTTSISGGNGDEAIQAAIDNARTGDTVYMPAGTYTLNEQININKGIWFEGAGIDVTILEVIAGTNGSQIIQVLTNESVVIRNFTIQTIGTNQTDVNLGNGLIHIGDAATYYTGYHRVTGIKCYRWLEHACVRWATRGIMDNVTVDMTSNQTTTYVAYIAYLWGSDTQAGDKGWAAPWDNGGNYATYLEDILHTGAKTQGKVLSDSETGARNVYRYNTVEGRIASHEGSTWRRATRWIAAHNNDFQEPALNPVNYRGGSGIVAHNNVNGQGSTGSVIATSSYRRHTSRGNWGNCSGVNPWDDNPTGAPLFTGTADAGSGAAFFVDAAAPWGSTNLNARIGTLRPAIHNTTTAASAKTSWSLDNTSGITSFDLQIKGGDPQVTFAAGDTYEVILIPHCIDEPGLGQSDLLDPTRVTKAYPNHEVEKIYAWNNTCDAQANCSPTILNADSTPTDHLVLGAHPVWVPYPYRCPNGTLAPTSTGDCTAYGGSAYGKQATCTYRNGCGHPARWHTSFFNVRSRPNAIAVGASGVLATSRPVVSTRPNYE